MRAVEPDQPSRRSGSATRERILVVALELFNAQGYDKTSLREIAERLGVTKAALYYHFERKEDILLALHLKLHELGRDLLEQLEGLDERAIVERWPALIDRFIDTVLANSDLFLVHQRNEQAFRQLAHSEQHQAENEDIEERFRRLLTNARIPLEQRVRMAASIGAVMSTLMAMGGVFGDVSTAEVAGYVRSVARDIYRPAR